MRSNDAPVRSGPIRSCAPTDFLKPLVRLRFGWFRSGSVRNGLHTCSVGRELLSVLLGVAELLTEPDRIWTDRVWTGRVGGTHKLNGTVVAIQWWTRIIHPVNNDLIILINMRDNRTTKGTERHQETSVNRIRQHLITDCPSQSPAECPHHPHEQLF